MEALKHIFAWGRYHLLILIIVLAAFLRLWDLAKIPIALNWDEISMGYSSYSILKTGRDEWGSFMPLLFRSYGEWKSPVYIYLLVPFIKVLGLNAWAVRLPAALFGILDIYLTYLIGKKLYGDKVGLWAAFLLAVSPWHLMLSRPAFEAGVALTLTLAGIYFMLKEKPLWAAIPFGLALHTYHSAQAVVPVVYLYLGFIFYRKFGLKKLLSSILILGIFVLSIALDFISGQTQKRFGQVGLTTDAEITQMFFKYRDTFPLGDLGNKLVFNKVTFILAKGFSNWTSYMSPHFLLGSESIRAQHSIPFRGVLYFSEFGLMAFGIFLIFKKNKGVARYLPILMIAIGFVPAALTKDIYHVLRSIMTLPWWQILAGVGMVELQNQKFKYLKLVYSLLAIEILVFLFLYFFWYGRAFARDWQYGYPEMTHWVASVESKYHHVYVTKAYGEPQLFFAFYNKWDPGWYQQENKKLLSYESLGYPWLDQLPEYSIGKYTFRDINWPVDNGKNENLFIGKGDDFWLDTPHPFEIKFPDGTTAFSAAEGK
jgi:4-amino-4-deoxy-L-arabinose transferase-like glycosyltransferase